MEKKKKPKRPINSGDKIYRQCFFSRTGHVRKTPLFFFLGVPIYKVRSDGIFICGHPGCHNPVDTKDGSPMDGMCDFHHYKGLRKFDRNAFMDKNYRDFLGPALFSAFMEVKNDNTLRTLDRHIALLELFIQEKLPALQEAAPIEQWETLREEFSALKESLVGVDISKDAENAIKNMQKCFDDRSNRQKAENQLRSLIKEFSDLVKVDSEIKKNNRTVLTADQANAYMHLVVDAVYKVLGDDEERVRHFRETLIDLYNRELGIRFGFASYAEPERELASRNAEDSIEAEAVDLS